MKTYEKIDENTVKVTEQVSEQKENTYNYEFLFNQRAAIIKQKEEYIAARNEELAEVDALIAECKKLGITTKQDVIE